MSKDKTATLLPEPTLDAKQPRVGRARRAYRRVVDKVPFLAGLAVLHLIYTMLGAVIMVVIESPQEDITRQEALDMRNNASSYVKNVTQKLLSDALNLSEWESLVERLVVDFEAGVVANPIAASAKKWTFSGGILFCIVTSTAIGYGNIAPVTPLGRIVTMIYAVIGIPLTLIILADLGRRLSIAYLFVWGFIQWLIDNSTSRFFNFVRKHGFRKRPRKTSTAAPQGGIDEVRHTASSNVDDHPMGGYRIIIVGEGKGNLAHISEEQLDLRESPSTELCSLASEDPEASETASSYCLAANSEYSAKHSRSEDASTLTTDNGTHPKAYVDLLGHAVDEIPEEHPSTAPPTQVDTPECKDKTEAVQENVEQIKGSTLPVLVAILFIFVYIFLGAAMYIQWEDWTYLDAFYFVFITMATVGYGDIVPQHQDFFLAAVVYTFLGLALVAMMLNVLVDFLQVTIKKAKTNVEKVGGMAVATLTEGVYTVNKAGGLAVATLTEGVYTVNKAGGLAVATLSEGVHTAGGMAVFTLAESVNTVKASRRAIGTLTEGVKLKVNKRGRLIVPHLSTRGHKHHKKKTSNV